MDCLAQKQAGGLKLFLSPELTGPMSHARGKEGEDIVETPHNPHVAA